MQVYASISFALLCNFQVGNTIDILRVINGISQVSIKEMFPFVLYLYK
jgi:hypothetical protein